jgi:hypothetical protein
MVDTFDPDHPVGVDTDDGAHLLQHRDQVHDLGFDGRVPQFGDPFGADGGEQHLLGRPDAGVGQRQLRATQPGRRRQGDALGLLLDDGAELAQHLEVVVDGAITDPAAPQVGNEGLTEAVQQWAAEQDRDPARAGVGVDVGDVGHLDVAGVELEHGRRAHGAHLHPVQLEQTRDHGDVPDLGHVLESAGLFAQQRGHHGLGDEVLGTPYRDGASQRSSAMNCQQVVSVGHGPIVTHATGRPQVGTARGVPMCSVRRCGGASLRY